MDNLTKLLPNQAIVPIANDELYCFLCDFHDQFRSWPVKISQNNALGELIFSLRRYSRMPIKQKLPNGWIPVLVEFPEVADSTSKKHFVYYPVEAINQINHALAALFDVYFHVYFNHHKDIDLDAEMEEEEKTRLMLIDSFIFGMGIKDYNHASEKVKKRAYREEVYELNRLRNKFRIKDFRFRQKVFDKRRKFIKEIVNQDDKKLISHL